MVHVYLDKGVDVERLCADDLRQGETQFFEGERFCDGCVFLALDNFGGFVCDVPAHLDALLDDCIFTGKKYVLKERENGNE